MTRTKSFSPHEALETALGVFWQNGYEAASVDDLCAAMSLNRGSLYGTFGGKHALYIAALQRYCESQVSSMTPVLEGAGPLQPRLRALFDHLCDGLVAEGGRRGCFAMNTLAELAPHDREATLQATKMLGQMEGAFRVALERARSDGEIVGDPAALAQFLVVVLQGLVVLARTDPGRETLREVMEVALSTIR